MRSREALLACILVLTAHGAAAQDLRALAVADLDAQFGPDARHDTRFILTSARAHKSKDPADPANWEAELTRSQACRMRVAGPDVRVDYLDPTLVVDQPGAPAWFAGEPGLSKSWVAGERRSLLQSKSGRWSARVDADRFALTLGRPLLTPFLLELFDIPGAGLASAARFPSTKFEAHGDRVRMKTRCITEGEAPADYAGPQVVWEVTADLDPTQRHLPTMLSAVARIPAGDFAGKTISWKMTTLRANVDSAGWYIEEALIQMLNEALSPDQRDRWQIYHFEVTERKPGGPDGPALALEFPTQNVRLVNEVARFSQVIDADGKILEEHTWTQEEREREIAAMRAANATAQQATLKYMPARRAALWWILAGALGVTVALIVVKQWKPS